jgi:hypothetical protein
MRLQQLPNASCAVQASSNLMKLQVYVLNAMLEIINLILDKLHVYPVLLVDTVTVIALSMVVTHHVLQELTIV